MNGPRPVGVLFDVDGTLVDTNYLHTTAWWEALRQHGHHVPMANIHRAIGMGAGRLLEHLLGRDPQRDDAGISSAHRTLYRTGWERLVPLPGATQLVRHCADVGFRVVLASSAEAPELAALRRVLDLDDVIDAATSSDDVDDSKPAPDVLQAAMDRVGLNADQTILVGDSVWDVAAAQRTGIECVGLECGGTSAAELRSAGAVEVYPDPGGLLDRFDRSALHRLRPDR